MELRHHPAHPKIVAVIIAGVLRWLRHAVDPFKAGAQSATHAQLGGNCCRESAKSFAQHRVPRQNSMSLEGQERCIGRVVKGLLDPNHRRWAIPARAKQRPQGCHIAEFIPHRLLHLSLISGFSCRTTFNKEPWTSIWPL